MSRAANRDKNLILMLITGTIVALLFALYSWLEPVSVLFLVLITSLAAVFVFDRKIGLLVLILIRPSLDIFTDYSIITINGHNLNFSSLLALLTLGAAAVIFLAEIKKLKKMPLRWPIAAFLLIAMVSSIFSFNPSSGFQELARLLSIFSLYLLGFTLIKSWDDLKMLTVVVIKKRYFNSR